MKPIHAGAILVVVIVLIILVIIPKPAKHEVELAAGPLTLEILDGRLSKVQKDQTVMKAKLESLEGLVRSKPAAAATAIPGAAGMTFVIDSVNPDNMETMAIWNPTNKPDLFMVSVRLSRNPDPKSVLVWTGTGMMPFEAYRVEGSSLSILMSQSKDAFVGTGNFINVRYVPAD